MEITILCKVVDNFGDIGVSYRLACGLKKKAPDASINLIVDNLESFHKICSKVDIHASVQSFDGLSVYDWNASEICSEIFYKDDGKKLQIILECFQCGRPDWMEKILFETKLQRTVQIIMIDYLTAEKYAEDFHCLQSLTRSSKVQKVNFMPGFTEKTGGLIIDDEWKKLSSYKADGHVLVFTYKRKMNAFFAALNEYAGLICHGEKKLDVMAAQGHGFESVCSGFESFTANSSLNDVNVNFIKLPFVNQYEWDSVMKNSSILFIRGEESLSRACLSGIPFVWHAYPQSDEYQLVKVNALLERMRCCFSEQDFSVIEKVWLCFNMPENQVSESDFKNSVYDFLYSAKRLTEGFRKFAMQLQKNGDLCDNLMTFINKKCIIS